MSLHLVTVQPYNGNKNCINAVPEAIALNRAYQPFSNPLVLSAAIKAGADPVVESLSQPQDGTDGQVTDYLGDHVIPEIDVAYCIPLETLVLPFLLRVHGRVGPLHHTDELIPWPDHHCTYAHGMAQLKHLQSGNERLDGLIHLGAFPDKHDDKFVSRCG